MGQASGNGNGNGNENDRGQTPCSRRLDGGAPLVNNPG